MQEVLITIITGTLGTLGFALMFKANKNRLFLITLGGFIVSVACVFCSEVFESQFYINLFPSLIIALYSEIAARLTKSPATPFIICGIVPLVPGKGLYYTMHYFIIGDSLMSSAYLSETLHIAAGIAVGIMVISVVIFELNKKKTYLAFVRDE
ncbi:MAG: threonine/serine exporter family protein [Clostridia bacterium]